MWTKTFSVFIHASPEEIFARVSDLTRHGEWSPTPLAIEPLPPSAVRSGSRYRSVGYTRGHAVTSEVEITAYEPPTRFTFVAASPSTTFRHEFTITPHKDGALVERTVTRLQAIPKVRLIGPMFHRFVLAPAARDAMAKLKSTVERDAAR